MPIPLGRRSLSLLALGAGVASVLPARAATLPDPSGPPVLVVSGKIGNVNRNGTATFDRPLLESVGMETVVTKTPWYKEAMEFQGVRLAALMKYVGAYGDRVLASALNDYTSELPLSDFIQYGTLLALKRNGEYLPVSDKGPLFIIYPFDSNPSLQQDKFYMRSVWQVSQLDVR